MLTVRLPALVLLGLLLAVLLASPVGAQVPQLPLGTWQSVGFEGTRVDALAVAEEGRLLYLATEQGPQASFDGGENWHYIGGDLDSQGAPPVVALAADPIGCDCLYAGTEPGPKGGLYASRDGGRHWQRLFAGSRRDGVRAIFAPGKPGTVYLSATTADGGDELLATADGGQSWRVLLSENGRSDQRHYAIATGQDGRLLVASSAGLLMSVDAGEHWRYSTGSPTLALATRPRLFQDRTSSLYAASERGLSQSFDVGSTWRPVAGPPSSACQTFGPDSVGLAQGRASTLVVATRSVCQDQPGRVHLLQGSPGSRTPTWVDIGAGLPHVPQYRLLVTGSAQPRAYALTASGLWSLDLPAPPLPATATPQSDATVAADDAPQPLPPAPVAVQVPQGEVKETAVGSAIDYALVFVALPVGAIVLLRWLLRRNGG